MKRFKIFSYLSIALLLINTSCSKEPVLDDDGSNTGENGSSGTVASYKVIPIPLVDVNNLIIPNLAAFHVTNKGAYVQVQDSKKPLWSFHKYHTGTNNWSSFKPDFVAMSFMPTTFSSEKDNEFSIYWNGDEKYGMYNLNNGSPSFEYEVPGPPLGPYIFSNIVPSKKGFHRIWGIIGSEIWIETAIESPKTFEKVGEIPMSEEISDYPRLFFADPDSETVLWCATQRGLFKVGSVSPNSGGEPGVLNSWDFSSISSTDLINTIIKVDNSIVVQFGKRVYKLNGTSFKSIGTLNLSATVVSNICTNGSTIYASDGTAYNSSKGTWDSFIGSGTNLTGENASRYDELKQYCSIALPIGVINGSTNGPVYLLAPNGLIEIHPK